MSKIVSSIKLFGKTLFIVALVFSSWAAINIAGFIKGKQSNFTEKDLRDKLFKVGVAKADVPVDCGKGSSTPFLAYFDGRKYKLENDIMFGRPKSFYPLYETAKKLYEDGKISPDLYKIAAPLKSFAGKILLQIQEIEVEESFLKRLELKRVVHPKNTEVIVDSEYKKFYVVDKAKFQERVAAPTSIASRNGADHTGRISDKKAIFETAIDSGDHIKFEKNDSVNIVFNGLKPGETPYLVVKSWFRDWVLGLEDEWRSMRNEKSEPAGLFGRRPISLYGKKIMVGSMLLILALVFSRKGEGWNLIKLLPLFMGATGSSGDSGSSGASASGATGDSAATGTNSCSFFYEYSDESGNSHQVAISEPRAWHYNTEIIEFPREAVLNDGSLHLTISSSKRHTLGFVGVLQNIDDVATDGYKEEAMGLTKAYHHRLKKDFAESVNDKSIACDLSDKLDLSDRLDISDRYIHTIPGDTVDLEFSAPSVPLKGDERETYLMQASGFYTSLRQESRILAGDWQNNISDEAKTRLASLVGLKNYE